MISSVTNVELDTHTVNTMINLILSRIVSSSNDNCYPLRLLPVRIFVRRGSSSFIVEHKPDGRCNYCLPLAITIAPFN